MTSASLFPKNTQFPEGLDIEHTVSFHRDGEFIGAFDFKNLPMTFHGDADEAASLFATFVIEKISDHIESLVEQEVERRMKSKSE